MAETPANNNADAHANYDISPADRQVLRRLAGRVAELAARDVEQEKRRLWTAHNDLAAATRPLVFCDPENGWGEIITDDQLASTAPLARDWEYRLRKEIFWGEQMRDDRVIEPCFNLMDIHTRTGWGLSEVRHGGQDGGAFNWEPPLKSLDDLGALRHQAIAIDHEATERRRQAAEAAFGDLLRVRRRNSWYWSLGLTTDLIKLRGMEQMMMDMYDNPSGLHRLMAFLRDGTLALVDLLQRDGLYTLNNQGDYVGSGGFGWTGQLPAEGFDGTVRTQDLWCLQESQETVGVSPEMFEEFVFQYQQPIAERFGRLCYGCCEPINGRWHVVKRMKNLRRVSVSPWADRSKMAEMLGGDYVYSLKPHPGLLAAPSFDADAVRADARDALARARGCRLEIIMKDNNTICHEPRRVTEWVRIVREEIDGMA